MKLIKSYCSNKNCPFDECERHHVNNKNGSREFNFEGTCPEYHEYFMKKLNERLKKKK